MGLRANVAQKKSLWTRAVVLGEAPILSPSLVIQPILRHSDVLEVRATQSRRYGKRISSDDKNCPWNKVSRGLNY